MGISGKPQCLTGGYAKPLVERLGKDSTASEIVQRKSRLKSHHAKCETEKKKSDPRKVSRQRKGKKTTRTNAHRLLKKKKTERG